MFKKNRRILKIFATVFLLLLLSLTAIVDTSFCKPLKKDTELSGIQDLDHPLNNDSTNWTIMYYFAADNKMTDNAKMFIQNLTQIRSNDELNIVILYDGFQQGDTKLYYVKNGGGLEDISGQFGWPDEVNMADKNTLSLSVNGHHLQTVTDNSFKEGTVSLGANCKTSNSFTEVSYNNLVITTI